MYFPLANQMNSQVMQDPRTHVPDELATVRNSSRYTANLSGTSSTGTTATAAAATAAAAEATGALLEAGMYGTPDGLTAEGLMLYLQTRMNGLDQQINDIFQKQQDIEKVRKLLGEMQTVLNQLNDNESVQDLQGTKNGSEGLADYEQQLADLLAGIEKLDPSLAQSLRGQLSAEGQILYCTDGLLLHERSG